VLTPRTISILASTATGDDGILYIEVHIAVMLFAAFNAHAL